MTGDAHGAQGDLPTSGLARLPQPQVGASFVAPVTLGRPRWRRRYARADLALQVAAIGSFPGLYLLWQHLVRAPLVAAALSVVVLSFGSWCALRGWLSHLRRRGRAMSTVLAVGDVDGRGGARRAHPAQLRPSAGASPVPARPPARGPDGARRGARRAGARRPRCRRGAGARGPCRRRRGRAGTRMDRGPAPASRPGPRFQPHRAARRSAADATASVRACG